MNEHSKWYASPCHTIWLVFLAPVHAVVLFARSCGQTRVSQRFARGLVSIQHFMHEHKEHQNPKLYGKRVPHRRLFLILGIILLTVILSKTADSYATTSVKQEAIDTLNKLDLGFSWPPDNHGGTIFDDVFNLYEVLDQVARQAHATVSARSMVRPRLSCLNRCKCHPVNSLQLTLLQTCC